MALQEILKRASEQNLNQDAVDLKASLGSLFNCSESISKMLSDLQAQIAANQGAEVLPEELVSMVHSAMLYVALDTPTFARMLANAKRGSKV